MFFTNATIYRIVSAIPANIEDALQAASFTPCGDTQESSSGWVPPRGAEHGALAESVDGNTILKLMMESKSIPTSVIKRKVDEQLTRIEAETGRKPGKKEKRELAEDAKLALLPMAFTKQSACLVWIDSRTGCLWIDTASSTTADAVLSALVRGIEGLVLQPLNTQSSASACMSQWLLAQEPPSNFSVDRECELKASDESKAVVRYKNHALDIDEVVDHITHGKVPTRLAMTHASRVSFLLSDNLTLRKITVLDIPDANDNHKDAFDADVAIGTAELRVLWTSLVDALGGEVDTAE